MEDLATAGAPGRSAPIVVVGAGGLGLSYSVALAAAQMRVTLVPSGRSFPRLAELGRVGVRGALELDVPLVVGRTAEAGQIRLARLAEVPIAAGVVITTKGRDLPAAAAGLASVATGWVFGVQNGMRKNHVLATRFGRERVLGGATSLPAERIDDNTALLTSVERTFVGELGAPPSTRAEEFVGLLRGAGLAAEAVADVLALEWAKLMQSASRHAAHLLDHVLAGSSGEVWTWDTRQRALVQVTLLREVGAVALAEGIELRDYPTLASFTDMNAPTNEVLARRSRWAAGGPSPRGSMQQDLASGRVVEADIFGDLVALAQQHGVDTPWLAAALAAARTINSHRERDGEA